MKLLRLAALVLIGVSQAHEEEAFLPSLEDEVEVDSLQDRVLVDYTTVDGNFTDGWLIPPELEDGFYMVEWPDLDLDPDQDDLNDELQGVQRRDSIFSGNAETWHAVDRTPNTGPRSRVNGTQAPFIIPWPADEVHCNRRARQLSSPSYREARDNLYSYCDKFVVSRRTRHLAISKNADVVVYACNYRPRSDRFCSREEFKWVEKYMLNPHCGQFAPAFAASGKLDMRYGRAWLGERICADKGLHDTSWVGSPDNVMSDPDAPAYENPHEGENRDFDRYHDKMEIARHAWEVNNKLKYYDLDYPQEFEGHRPGPKGRERKKVKYHRGAMGNGEALEDGLPATDVYLQDNTYLPDAVVLKAGTPVMKDPPLKNNEALEDQRGYENAWDTPNTRQNDALYGNDDWDKDEKVDDNALEKPHVELGYSPGVW